MEFKIKFEPFYEQYQAMQKLRDGVTKFLLFGGGAGGGKSWLGCEWIIENCLMYPGTKWFIGRNELKRIMSSTFITFTKVLKEHGISDKDWHLNSQYNYILFSNGSRVDLLDLQYRPSDPMYERFGSLEYTGGWIEEAGETDFGAFDVLKSRINRHLNTNYGIYGKILLTCNPKKNWLYHMIYKPWRDNKLSRQYSFIQSLYQDNPHTKDLYGQSLAEITDVATKQRLMYGNWEYDDDPAKLCEYEAILDMFTNDFVPEGKKYLSSDLAMQGRDKFVIMSWSGLRCKIWNEKEVRAKIENLKLGQDAVEIAKVIQDAMRDTETPRSQTVADSDGMGAFIGSYLKGIKEFSGGDKATNDEFMNLRAECCFKLAELINKRAIYIDCKDEKIKNQIIEELEQLKRDQVDNDESKKRIVKKDVIKEHLGRSPDFMDTLMMRMSYEVKKKVGFGFINARREKD